MAESTGRQHEDHRTKKVPGWSAGRQRNDKHWKGKYRQVILPDHWRRWQHFIYRGHRMTLADKIGDLFDDAEDVNDTIWYTQFETLYDAIIRTIEEYNQE